MDGFNMRIVKTFKVDRIYFDGNGLSISFVGTADVETVLDIERKKTERAPIQGGYQPDHGNLDPSNPPQGGSGLPHKK